MAVAFEIRGLIGDRILAAQLVLYLGEGVGHVANLERKERAATRGIGNSLQDFVACALGAAHIGADRVNNRFRALRHFNGFFACNVTQIVFAVAQQNNCPPRSRIERCLQKLVPASKIKRVIKRSAAARPQLMNTVCQRLGVVREILGDLGSGIKANHECAVIFRPNRLIEEFDGRLLFELEAIAHRIAGIDQQAHAQGQVCFAVKAANFFDRLAIVHYLKVALLEVGNPPSVLIGYRKDNIYFVGTDNKAGNIIGGAGIWRILIRGLLRVRSSSGRAPRVRILGGGLR
jgi:hypothetical protein